MSIPGSRSHSRSPRQAPVLYSPRDQKQPLRATPGEACPVFPGNPRVFRATRVRGGGHADPVPVSHPRAGHRGVPDPLPGTGAGTADLWLIPSPELWMKTAARPQAPETYSRSAAASETGTSEARLHNPEFRLLEWYTVGIGYRESIAVPEGLFSHLMLGRIRKAGPTPLPPFRATHHGGGIPAIRRGSTWRTARNRGASCARPAQERSLHAGWTHVGGGVSHHFPHPRWSPALRGKSPLFCSTTRPSCPDDGRRRGHPLGGEMGAVRGRRGDRQLLHRGDGHGRSGTLLRAGRRSERESAGSQHAIDTGLAAPFPPAFRLSAARLSASTGSRWSSRERNRWRG